MSRQLSHRFDFLVSRRFDIALAVSAATLGYLSHEKEAYPKPNDRLVPLFKQHVHREYPVAGHYWDQAEQVLDQFKARLPAWPSPTTNSRTTGDNGQASSSKFKLGDQQDAGAAVSSSSAVDEEKALQQWMAQLTDGDKQ